MVELKLEGRYSLAQNDVQHQAMTKLTQTSMPVTYLIVQYYYYYYSVVRYRRYLEGGGGGGGEDFNANYRCRLKREVTRQYEVTEYLLIHTF